MNTRKGPRAAALPLATVPAPERELSTCETVITHALFDDVLLVRAGVSQGCALRAAQAMQRMASELLTLGVDEPDDTEARGYQAVRTAAMFISEVSTALLSALTAAHAARPQGGRP